MTNTDESIAKNAENLFKKGFWVIITASSKNKVKVGIKTANLPKNA
jgi:hypothetical protein